MKYKIGMVGLVFNNWLNYLLFFLQLVRISIVFFFVFVLKYFILWMQVLFSLQLVYRYCLSGYFVVRFGIQNNVVVFFFFRVLKNVFCGSFLKIIIYIMVILVNYIYFGNIVDYLVEEQWVYIILEICRLEIRIDKN